MNINTASQHQGVLAFTGINAAAISPAVDIRHHVNFSFTFQVVADIAVDAIFNIQAAPPSVPDPCLPGAFVDVPETIICDWMTVQPQPHSHITIPAGTKAGSICTGTLPCKPDAFIKVVPVSGDTSNVHITVTLSGPK
jgi:hypothetical protein